MVLLSFKGYDRYDFGVAPTPTAPLLLCSEVAACKGKPSCGKAIAEAADACAKAAYPDASAAYIRLDHATLTDLVQGKGRYKDYRIPLDKACAIAKFMDPASTAGYMGLVVYVGFEDTIRQASVSAPRGSLHSVLRDRSTWTAPCRTAL